MSAVYGFPVFGLPIADKVALELHKRRVLALRERFERRCRAELTAETVKQLNLDLGESEEAAKLAEARFMQRQQDQAVDE